MQEIECEEHKVALRYCGNCLKLVCGQCEKQEHPHGTQKLSEVDPNEIKGSMAKKHQSLAGLAERLSGYQKLLQEAQRTRLFFADKKPANEFDVSLFSELALVLSDVREESQALKGILEQCQPHTAAISTIVAEVDTTGQLLASFDEDIRDPKKFAARYLKRESSREPDIQAIDGPMEQLAKHMKEYQQRLGRIMPVLDKYWSDMLPGKLETLKNFEQDTKDKTRQLGKISQNLQACKKEQETILAKAAAQVKAAETQIAQNAELLSLIRSKRLHEQVSAIMQEAATKTALEQERNKLESNNAQLREMQEILQRGLIAKSKELDDCKAAIARCGSELQSHQEKMRDLTVQASQKQESIQTDIAANNQKLQTIRTELQSIAHTHEEMKSTIEATEKATKESKEAYRRMMEFAETQKALIKENGKLLTKQKLEIADYSENMAKELIKNGANVKAIATKLESLRDKKKELESWLGLHQTQIVATLVALAAFQRGTGRYAREMQAKQQEATQITEQVQAASAQLKELHSLYVQHQSRIAEFSARLQSSREQLASEVEKSECRLKEVLGCVENIKENYVKNKCARCMQHTTSPQVLQCNHSLCANCEAAALVTYRLEPESFKVQCHICNKLSTAIFTHLRCGCLLEISQFAAFKDSIKEETNGHCVYYNSYELTISQPRCHNGHEIGDAELASFYREPLNLNESRARLQGLMAQDQASTKRAEVIKTVLGKTEARIFNARLKLGNDGARYLGDTLRGLKNLEKMDLDGNLIGDEGIGYLAVALKYHAGTLIVLDIRRNLVGDEGMRRLARTLELMQKLKEFNASSNKLSAQSGKYIGQVLKHMPVLNLLHLSQNELGPKGCVWLAEGLAESKSVETLFLSNNRILNEGVTAIGKALVTNQSLKHLHIQSNLIGPDGLQALAQGLEKNESVLTLDLRFNKFGSAGETICSKLEDTHDPPITITYC